jgi:hypothetical protein
VLKDVSAFANAASEEGETYRRQAVAECILMEMSLARGSGKRYLKGSRGHR